MIQFVPLNIKGSENNIGTDSNELWQRCATTVPHTPWLLCKHVTSNPHVQLDVLYHIFAKLSGTRHKVIGWNLSKGDVEIEYRWDGQT